jgi:hypothetical protein
MRMRLRPLKELLHEMLERSVIPSRAALRIKVTEGQLVEVIVSNTDGSRRTGIASFPKP